MGVACTGEWGRTIMRGGMGGHEDGLEERGGGSEEAAGEGMFKIMGGVAWTDVFTSEFLSASVSFAPATACLVVFVSIGRGPVAASGTCRGMAASLASPPFVLVNPRACAESIPSSVGVVTSGAHVIMSHVGEVTSMAASSGSDMVTSMVAVSSCMGVVPFVARGSGEGISSFSVGLVTPCARVVVFFAYCVCRNP